MKPLLLSYTAVVALLSVVVVCASSSAEATLLEELVSRGDWTRSIELVGGAADKTALRQAIDRGAATYRAALEAVVAAAREEAAPLRKTLAPAFRWAQNATTLALEVKFAHSIAAPAATDTAVDSVTVDGRTFRVRASSKSSSSTEKRHWELLVAELWGGLVGDTPTPTASAGRVSILLTKATPAHWPRLVRCGFDLPPSSAGIWLDMQLQMGYNDDDDDDEPCAPNKEENELESAVLAKIDEVKKESLKARRTVKREAGALRERIGLDERSANARLAADTDRRRNYLDAGPPPWMPRWLPAAVVVYDDGIWDLYLQVAAARNSSSSLVQRRWSSLAKLDVVLALVFLFVLCGGSRRRRLRFFTALLGLFAALGHFAIACVVLHCLKRPDPAAN